MEKILEVQDIVHMKTLEYKIEKYSNNKNYIQFLLIGNIFIYLYEYSKEEGCKLLYSSKCFFDNLEHKEDYGDKSGSFQIDERYIMIGIKKRLYIFDLYYFQINSIIDSYIYTFTRINEHKILCNQTQILNFEDMNLEYFSYGPNQLTAVFIFKNYFIYEIAGNLIFTDLISLKRIYVPHHVINNNYIFSFNEKQLGIYYEKFGFRGTSHLDIYEFIE